MRLVAPIRLLALQVPTPVLVTFYHLLMACRTRTVLFTIPRLVYRRYTRARHPLINLMIR